MLKELIRLGSYYRYDSLKYIVSFGSELFLPFTKKQMKEEIYIRAIELYDRIYKLHLSKERFPLAMTYLMACSDAKDSNSGLEVVTRIPIVEENFQPFNVSMSSYPGR